MSFKRVNMGQQMAQRMLRNNLHAATYTSETHMRVKTARSSSTLAKELAHTRIACAPLRAAEFIPEPC